MAKFNTWRIGCLLCVVLLAVVGVACFIISLLVSKGCVEGNFKHAAVSADTPICSKIGRDMLQQGGSAVDGAIAALLCTSLMNPQSMGLGGGSIFTIMDQTGKVKIFSSRETVPQLFKADLLDHCPKTVQLTTGAQWIGVPGELKGYEAVHRHYGRLPWAKLFEPSIKLAREGFPMPPFLGQMLREPQIANLVKNSSLCEVFCNEQKNLLSMGDTLKFPRLAETMETIAKQGADTFYRHKLGHDLIQDIQDAGGSLTMDDLKMYKVLEEDPWSVPIGAYQMHFPPPPAGGAILAFILNIMKGFQLSPLSMDSASQKVLTYHSYVEAAKFANGQRRTILDLRFHPENNASHLIDLTFAESVRSLITKEGSHNDSYYNVKSSPDGFGTTHISVLDKEGSAVSVTSTINHMFGAAVYSPKTGIILNNELVDFCGRADTVKSGEQPPSSMAPVIMRSLSGEKILVIGGSGGRMITTAMALSIMNHLLLGMSLQDAIAAPIVFVDSKNALIFERGFDKSVIEALKALGHKVQTYSYFFNVVNAVAKEGGCITAVSDSRKVGQAAGY